MVPILINKDVLEPSYNNLKFRARNHVLLLHQHNSWVYRLWGGGQEWMRQGVGWRDRTVEEWKWWRLSLGMGSNQRQEKKHEIYFLITGWEVWVWFTRLVAKLVRAFPERYFVANTIKHKNNEFRESIQTKNKKQSTVHLLQWLQNESGNQMWPSWHKAWQTQKRRSLDLTGDTRGDDRCGIWDLKNRGTRGLEPGWGHKIRDVDRQVGTNGHMRPTDGTSLTWVCLEEANYQR